MPLPPSMLPLLLPEEDPLDEDALPLLLPLDDDAPPLLLPDELPDDDALPLLLPEDPLEPLYPGPPS